MGTFIGGIIGLGFGSLLSVMFIFPDDALSTPLSAMTLGYILRILGGVMVTLAGAGFGGLIGESIEENKDESGRRQDRAPERSAEIEPGKVPSSLIQKMPITKTSEEEKVERFFARLDEEEAARRVKAARRAKRVASIRKIFSKVR